METNVSNKMAAQTNFISSLPLLSYNSTGWNENKSEFLKTLLISHQIGVGALQEHFQLKNNLYKLNCFENFETFSVGAQKSNNYIHSGRPSGGLTFIYNKNLCQYVERLPIPTSNRVQGMKLDLPGMPLLLINSYFPTDPGGGSVNEDLLLSTLQDISSLINSVGDHYCVILMGDLNTDFSRNSIHAQIVKNFCVEKELSTVWSVFPPDFTYYHERFQNGRTIVSKSTIDHFCLSEDFVNFCVEATPLHFTENSSKHEPIFMKFVLNNPIHPVTHNDAVVFKRENSPLWNKASTSDINNFISELNHSIKNIPIDACTLSCENVNCTSETHRLNLDTMSQDLLTCISDAVKHNIPLSSNSKPHKIMPGWSEFVAPLKDQSIFWKSVWISAGRPLDNILHQLMKRTRNKYHFAVRKIKRLEQEIQKSKFLQSCLDGDVTDIFTEIKRIRDKNSNNSRVVDGYSTDVGITDNFKRLYADIYNAHDDEEDLGRTLHENNKLISDGDLQTVSLITPDLVTKIINNFHNNKNDSYISSKSNSFKHAVGILAEPISDLLKCMLVHGYIPRIFLLCSLVPLVKNRNASKAKSDNYRLIAISSIMLKILDHAVLSICDSDLQPSHHQLGFQKGLSTTLCTWLVQETVNYFRNRGSPVYLCCMDLTKAFDNVKLSLLFQKLKNKVPPILIRILIHSYINQECFISWNGVKSSVFGINNGVRQGAVLSPTLFNIYIDDIQQKLRNSGFGCRIDSLYFGCFAYADDLSLIAPTREALQEMINVCVKYFDEHGIKISTNQDIRKTKTKVLVFGIKENPANIMLNDRPLPYVESWYHLGHLINSDESTSHDIDEKRREFIGKIHSFRQEFGDQHPLVFFKLVRSFFLHFYGSSLWDLNCVQIERLWSCWHKIIKSTYNLPFPTHRYLLHDLVPYEHIKTMITRRFKKFYMKIKQCENPYVTVLHTVQSHDWRSTYGKNILSLCRHANATNLEDADMSDFSVFPVPDDQKWRIPLIKYLIEESNNPSNFFNHDELELRMHTVCCS